MMKPSTYFLFLFFWIVFFFRINVLFGQEDIAWFNDYTTEMQVGSSTYQYRFKSVEGNKGYLAIDEKITNKKGECNLKTYQLHIADINRSALKFKTKGEIAMVNLEIKQLQKLIKVYKNGQEDGYTDRININLGRIYYTRAFIDLLIAKGDSCQKAEENWSSTEALKTWLAGQISTSKLSGTAWTQQLKTRGKSYLLGIEAASADQKGIFQSLVYDFNLKDLDPAKVLFRQEEAVFSIELQTLENSYLIRSIKDEKEINFVKSIKLFSDDFEQARRIYVGMTNLIVRTPAVERAGWTDYGQALQFFKTSLGEVNYGSVQYGQAFNFEPSKSGKVSLTIKKPGPSASGETAIHQFYLFDLQPEIYFGTSSKGISLGLKVKAKNKYIQTIADTLGYLYSSEIEFYEQDLERAREQALALKTAIELSEEGIIKSEDLTTNIQWLTTHLTDVRTDLGKVYQSIEVDPTIENKITIKQHKPNSEGGTTVDEAELYPQDLVPCKLSVDRKKLTAILSTGKLKYIRNKRNNELFSFSNSSELYFDDLKQAKNFVAALDLLHDQSMGSGRVFRDEQSALSYITAIVSTLIIDGQTFNQHFEADSNFPYFGKYSVTEVGKKGETIETVYEFAYSDIDTDLSYILVDLKTLNVVLYSKKKEKLIKPFVNGVPGNFTNKIEIVTDDLLTAKKLLAAFGSLKILH